MTEPDPGAAPSTAAGTPGPARPVEVPGSFTARGAAERAQTERHPAGHERDDESGDPERPAPTPPDAAVSGEAAGLEDSNVIPNLHEAPPSRPRTKTDESPTGISGSRIESSRRSSRPSGARSTEHPGTDHGETGPGPAHESGTERDRVGPERGESDVVAASQQRGTARSSRQTHVAPPAEAPAPDRPAGHGRAGPTVPGDTGPQETEQEGQDRVFEREEHEQGTEPLVPAAADREQRPGMDHPGMDHGESGLGRGETGTGLGDTGAAMSSSVREDVAPAADSAVPDRPTGPGGTKATGSDQPASQRGGHGEPGRESGREESTRVAGSLLPAADGAHTRGTPPAEPAASVHARRDNPASDAPPAPGADRARATPAARRVAASRERELVKDDTSPTIRVTIGRVEVRAVAPAPAPPPPVARSEPGLSLEDYLQQHGGGRR